MEKNMMTPAPGIEPGPAGWEPAILTPRPCRMILIVLNYKLTDYFFPKKVE